MARSDSSSAPPANKGAPDPPAEVVARTWDERLVDGVLARRREVGGLMLFLAAVVTLLALFGVTEAGWVNWWTRVLRQVLGGGA